MVRVFPPAVYPVPVTSLELVYTNVAEDKSARAVYRATL
jgi:hypothetical protein